MKLPNQAEPVIRIPLPVSNKTGLGDLIKTATGAIGIDPCEGCQRRAAVLNSWIGFTPIGGPSKSPR